MSKVVAVNDRGFRVGQDHQNAKLTNHEVDLLLELRDEGWSYGKLRDAFELSKSGVRKICKGMTRCQVADRYKKIEETA